jgi:hypothetical protein
MELGPNNDQLHLLHMMPSMLSHDPHWRGFFILNPGNGQGAIWPWHCGCLSALLLTMRNK